MEEVREISSSADNPKDQQEPNLETPYHPARPMVVAEWLADPVPSPDQADAVTQVPRDSIQDRQEERKLYRN